MSKSVFCLSDNEFQTEKIVEQLKDGGFSNNDISVLFPDKSGTKILLMSNTPRHRRVQLQEQVPGEH